MRELNLTSINTYASSLDKFPSDLTRREINKYFYLKDAKVKFPAPNKTIMRKALYRLRKFENGYGERLEGLEYINTLEHFLSEVVNAYF